MTVLLVPSSQMPRRCPSVVLISTPGNTTRLVSAAAICIASHQAAVLWSVIAIASMPAEIAADTISLAVP